MVFLLFIRGHNLLGTIFIECVCVSYTIYVLKASNCNKENSADHVMVAFNLYDNNLTFVYYFSLASL